MWTGGWWLVRVKNRMHLPTEAFSQVEGMKNEEICRIASAARSKRHSSHEL